MTLKQQTFSRTKYNEQTMSAEKEQVSEMSLKSKHGDCWHRKGKHNGQKKRCRRVADFSKKQETKIRE